MYIVLAILFCCAVELFILPKIKCVGRYWQMQDEYKAKSGETERYNYPDPDRRTSQWLIGSHLFCLVILALAVWLSCS
jgi:hypothetical protein